MLTSFQSYERPMYFYKLNDNYKGTVPVILQGIKLTKGWTRFENAQRQLDSMIRKYNNKEGIIDEKIEDAKQHVFYNSEIEYKKKKILYTRDVLASFDRENIESICKQWNIVHVNKRSEFLINVILKKQDEYRKFNELNKQEELKEDAEVISPITGVEFNNSENILKSDDEKKDETITLENAIKDEIPC